MPLQKKSPITDPLCQYLHAHGHLSDQQWQLALLQHEATGESLPRVLNMMGAIPYKVLISAMLELGLDELYGEESFSSQIDPQLLVDLKAMVVAEQGSSLFVASSQPADLVHQVLSLHYPELTFTFVPCDTGRLSNYLSRLSSSKERSLLLESLLNRAAALGASDVHIIPKETSFMVMFRYLGTRYPIHEGTRREYSYLASRLKDRATMDLAERRVPQDGSFTFEFESRQITVRVASTPSLHGEIVVMRLLDPKSAAPEITQLGITRIDDWLSGISRPNGLCLVCGPTGSGKSTTLNSSTLSLDRLGLAIYTLEDPVEARIPQVNQVQINRKVGLDFAKGIRALMRLDPDVIVVGEIRDEATAKAAISAAETGHSVLATLHSHSIDGAFRRLRALGVSDDDMIPLIRAILAQRLVRQLCTQCKGVGCPHCLGTGYAKRTLVSECKYFNSDAQVAAALSGQRSWPTVLEDATLKLKQGITSRQEVLRVFGSEAQAYFDEQESNPS